MRLCKRLVQASLWEEFHWWVELGLVPLMRRAVLRKILSSLSTDVWDCVPPCWLFGLRLPSTGGHRLLDGASCGLWEGSHQ